MKKIIYLLFALCTVTSCNNDDDGSTTTGNTDEYFKYTIDGVERIFDYDTEGHLETDSSTIIDKYEINASGQQPSGDFRRISAVFTFDSSGSFMPNTNYNWGIALDSNPTAKFYFSENTFSNLFVLSLDFSSHPITATVTSTTSNNVGDYIEFDFSGTYLDDNNVTHNISGVCRVKRDADQNY
ncbi:hypothetical protein [uncultured Winogradskyella sp.]|uniref:hypothetical protein n=1 Tax=uncultured Winogradskyella sp. TaxID=395353 RepID=UPI0030EF5D2A|tara:strand:+ start:9073 stop:9621 length:549 start_codon:yes stop_codon:yes gene_type:complete